jgi:hypothetical protein
VHWSSHSNEKYQFKNKPKVIDLGLRLSDVKAMGLQSEPQIHEQQKDPAEKFYDWDDCDVTEEECDFLRGEKTDAGWEGQRVELNAMTSAQVIKWLERKLDEAGVEKVVPDKATLATAWNRAIAIAKAREMIRQIEEGEVATPPKNLGKLVRAILHDDRELSWDQAIVRIASSHGNRYNFNKSRRR